MDVDCFRGPKPPLNPELDRCRKHYCIYMFCSNLFTFGFMDGCCHLALSDQCPFALLQTAFLQCRACLDIFQVNLAAVKTIMRIQSLTVIKIVAVWLSTLKLFKMPLLISRNVASLSIVNVVLIVQTVYMLCFRTSGYFIVIAVRVA